MAWTAEQLEPIGRAEELRLVARRRDGSFRSFTTMWLDLVAGQRTPNDSRKWNRER